MREHDLSSCRIGKLITAIKLGQAPVETCDLLAIADMKSLAEALSALPETADELRAVADNLGAKPEDIELGEAATVTGRG
jgi:hypothetical protein